MKVKTIPCGSEVSAAQQIIDAFLGGKILPRQAKLASIRVLNAYRNVSHTMQGNIDLVVTTAAQIDRFPTVH